MHNRTDYTKSAGQQHPTHRKAIAQTQTCTSAQPWHHRTLVLGCILLMREHLVTGSGAPSIFVRHRILQAIAEKKQTRTNNTIP